MFFAKSSFILSARNYDLRSKRYFWAWLNIIFNRIDQSRIKEVGPDRACAEWLLRNGAVVTFAGEEPTNDYNVLARLPVGISKALTQVDASDSSITYHGFGHFKNCKHVKSIKLHKNSYVNDDAVSNLGYVKDSLQHLHISSCDEVTDKGVLSLVQLKKLTNLTLYDLGVKNWIDCEATLKKSIPICNINLQSN